MVVQTMAYIEAKNITYYYPEEKRKTLEDINFSINKGEFILVLGSSGSGKSSLLRTLTGTIPEFYGGRFGGSITINEEELSNIDTKKRVQKVGMVFQDPEKQIIMLDVQRELVFSLENLGYKQQFIKKRLAEISAYFNFESILGKKTNELSGGEKQKLEIASVLMVNPEILILDEPTSQLDPQSSEDIIHILERLNEDFGLTVIIAEQRIDRCFKAADKIMFVDGGRVAKFSDKLDFCSWAVKNNLNYIPSIAKFFKIIDEKEIPFTVKQAKKYLVRNLCSSSLQQNHNTNETESKLESQLQNCVVELKNISYSYDGIRNVVNKLNLDIHSNEILCILGANGAGKSTLLKIICELIKPTQGKVKKAGKLRIGYLSQNPNDYLFKNTLYNELKFTLDNLNIKDYENIDKILYKFKILDYKGKNPRDLSGGERQRAAFAAVAVSKPDILILDEPTRGIDNDLKTEFAQILNEYRNEGKSVIIVTHDVDFVGDIADKAAIMFDGEIVAYGDKRDVLSDGLFYSTSINRLFREINPRILNIEDALKVYKRLNYEE